MWWNHRSLSHTGWLTKNTSVKNRTAPSTPSSLPTRNQVIQNRWPASCPYDRYHSHNDQKNRRIDVTLRLVGRSFNCIFARSLRVEIRPATTFFVLSISWCETRVETELRIKSLTVERLSTIHAIKYGCLHMDYTYGSLHTGVHLWMLTNRCLYTDRRTNPSKAKQRKAKQSKAKQSKAASQPKRQRENRAGTAMTKKKHLCHQTQS